MGKRIPACQLQATALKSKLDELTDLFHSLKLMGTKGLHDYITVFRPPVNISGIYYDVFLYLCTIKLTVNVIVCFPITCSSTCKYSAL